jgi:hypothetical protein
MFTDTQLRQLSYCVAEELRVRMAGKPPGPQPWLRELLSALHNAVAMSPSRHSGDGRDADSDHDDRIIGTPAAAEILGWTTKQVQRRTADLDGQKVGGKLMFRATAVAAYAEALNGA